MLSSQTSSNSQMLFFKLKMPTFHMSGWIVNNVTISIWWCKKWMQWEKIFVTATFEGGNVMRGIKMEPRCFRPLLIFQWHWRLHLWAVGVNTIMEERGKHTEQDAEFMLWNTCFSGFVCKWKMKRGRYEGCETVDCVEKHGRDVPHKTVKGCEQTPLSYGKSFPCVWCHTIGSRKQHLAHWSCLKEYLAVLESDHCLRPLWDDGSTFLRRRDILQPSFCQQNQGF